jgi:DNA (cytosine-5)-methyltransferase 1
MRIENPLKGMTEYGWHFEQNVYELNSLVRSLKAGDGSGNIPKIIEVYDENEIQAEEKESGR